MITSPYSLEQHAVGQLARALEIATGASPSDVFERAETFHCIMTNYDVPLESAMEWIHTRTPAKEYSGVEFRAFCRTYADERAAARRADLERRP